MTEETIAAISTPLGEGGIGIVRLSGRDAIPIADKLFISRKGKRLSTADSHTVLYGLVKEPLQGTTVDEVLVTVMRAPHTYTREDVVEINCHGGFLALRRVLELVLSLGARLAEPGEFTRRAFLNGRIDLSQAEAVIDLIRAKTDASRRMAVEQLSGGLSERITILRDRITAVCAHVEAYLDFPEEEIEPASTEHIDEEVRLVRDELTALSMSFEEGRFFREGLKVAIVGRPNVGKSSLLNALLQRDRAIVTEDAGTTRDVIEEYLNIKGLPVRIMDTAGIRKAHDMAEREGVMRSLNALDSADLVIGVVDGSTDLHEEDRMVLERLREKRSVIAVNKADLPSADKDPEALFREYSEDVVRISATKGTGLEQLKELIIDVSLGGGSRSAAGQFLNECGAVVTNIRHKVSIDRARDALGRAREALNAGQPLEIVAMELRDGLDRLGEIVGVVTTEDILGRVFREFCIGK